jgi:hypothetical protein
MSGCGEISPRWHGEADGHRRCRGEISPRALEPADADAEADVGEMRWNFTADLDATTGEASPADAR